MKLITLKAWASANFDPPPSLNTVRRWVRVGLIMPLPVKHGRQYYIEPTASYVAVKSEKIPRGRLVDRVLMARTG
ncbi:Excisionase-like protein [compost metagenome]